ncbi:hypothetical protein ACHHYP_07878 [Achlya hypogyna]|uniref:START domain-containing protein n=1 Tax=Achlya hypogyna TaxID=1202772 RepID=A0A1V9ZLC9_ACHHY|nr:hypothetical protein ACHHYP_07878 [Achlya hypogyna]
MSSRRPSSPRLRATSSSSSVSDEREPTVLVRRVNSVSKVVTPDRCKCCLRLFTKMLTTKQCFRCKNYMCALCVFKVPMFHGEKGKLPKHSLHARLCANCYDESILCDTNSASQPEMSPSSGRDNATLFDDCDDCDCSRTNASEVPQDPSPSSTAALWLSLVTGGFMLGAVLLEHCEFHVRVGGLVVLYVAFVAIHPLWRSSRADTPVAVIKSSKQRDASGAETASSDDDEPAVNMDTVLRAKKATLEARWAELTSSPEWVKNESKSSSTITISELDAGDDMPVVIKAETFVPNATADELLSFFASPDPKDRIKWDSHMASHTVIESVQWSDTQMGRVVHNVQKAHGFGIVPSRDFVLLAYRMSPLVYVQGSLDHPAVPERPSSVRGHLHILGFECTPTDDGLHLTYINQIDIRGSLPRKLVTSGTTDNMTKLMTTASQAKKKWL